MKPTKEEIEKFINYCGFLFGKKPFVNKEDDLYIYDRLYRHKYNYYEYNVYDKYDRGYFANDLRTSYKHKIIPIIDLMPGYKKYLLLK